MYSRASWAALLAVLAAITWRAFGGALAAGWTDTDALADFAFAKAPLSQQFFSPLTGGLGGDNANFWRPAATINYWLLRQLFGDNPVGWHAWDLGLHVIASALAARVAWAGSKDALLTWLTGILFCAHPLAVEIVPAIPRNLDLLLAIGFFGAMATVGTWTFLPCVALALAAKESALVLIPVLAVWARERTPWRSFLALNTAYLIAHTWVLDGAGGYGTTPDVVAAVIRAPVELYMSALSPAFDRMPPNPVPAALIGVAVYYAARDGAHRRLWVTLATLGVVYVALLGIAGTYSRRLLYVPTLAAVLALALTLTHGVRNRGRWSMIGAGVGLSLWLQGSPLVHPDEDWALTGQVAAVYTDARRYENIASGTTLWLVDRPVRVDYDPRRFRLWSDKLSLNHTLSSYSLKSWLDEHVRPGIYVRNLTGFSAFGLGKSAGITRSGAAFHIDRNVERSVWATTEWAVDTSHGLTLTPGALTTPAALVIWNPDAITVVPVTPPAETEKKFLAIDGTIYTDKLFHGLLDLDESPAPITATEADDILRVLTLLEDKFRKNQYYDEQVMAILSATQRQFLERNAEGITGEKMHENFSPEKIHAIVDDLEAIAQVQRPVDEVSVPDEVGPLVRPTTISRMTTFMLGYRGLQADPTLAIGRDDAARLLPFVDSYVRMKSMQQSTKHDILEILSMEQKLWIDRHPSTDEAVADMTRLEARVKAAMQARVDSE